MTPKSPFAYHSFTFGQESTMRFKILPGLALLLGLSTACADPDPATAVVLSVKTDMALSGMAVRVYGADADLKNPATPPAQEISIPAADIAKSIPVYRGSHDEAIVVIRGFGSANPTQPVVEHSVRVRFVNGHSTAVPVYLASACTTAGTAPCPIPGETCYGEQHGSLCAGTCGPIAEAEGAFQIERAGDELNWQPKLSCPFLDGGLHDAGDASDATPDRVLDGSPDPGPCKLTPGNPCTIAPQCGCPSTRTCRTADLTNATAPLFSCDAIGPVGV
ncbi:MAG: hypothetical protein JWN48_5640, partial [Myxococcaceae bacterium]|nr:hypothetical protein [Myxococcaceae bacterium]